MITCEIHKYIFNKCNEKQLASSHEWQIIDLASIMKKISCNKDHSIEDFDVQIIVQLEDIPRDKDHARKRRNQFTL